LVDRLGLDRPGGDKLVLDQSMVGGLLGGASSRILEAVQILVQLEPHLLNRQVMLRGVSQDNEDSSESVTTVIRGVLNGAKVRTSICGVPVQEGSDLLTRTDFQVSLTSDWLTVRCYVWPSSDQSDQFGSTGMVQFRFNFLA
ncbi:hypothetical protein GOODEAATRI_031015, partial [Goodea atripinnis]